ncbi:probable arginine--tRNA ligase, mitochondrial isoform X2 [Cimex lectularius]|nr:probable arginine--tRNA ligase, mitochondrial isoform X2 [Cimex lectularius]
MKKDDIIQKVHEKEGRIFFSVRKSEIVKECLFPQFNSENVLKKRNILVEYSSPNIAKPFHFGHLRSTIVGHFVSNILSRDNKITRINYLGDWGTQIGFVKLGLEKDNKQDFSSNPIKAMYDAYVEACTSHNSTEEAKEIFTKLENGDEKENQEWKYMRDEAIKHLVETYQTLGISFDEFSCESDYKASSVKELFNTLLEKKKVAFENGQLGMHLNGQFVPLMRQNNTTLYLSRDVAAALDRFEKYGCDKILYVVDKSQSNHMDNLKEAICNISGLNIIEHVPFGRVVGMSTRKGTSIFLEDILDKVCIKMAEQQKNSLNTKTSDPDTTRILGLSALSVNILRHNRLRDFKFNWDTAMQGTGDSGIKIQYTHCRLKSLEEKFDDRVVDKCDPSLLNEDIAVELALVLFEFDDVLLHTSKDLESSYLVQYLFRVCNLCAKALTQLFVKDQPVEIGNQRLLLFRKVRETLYISMQLLGLKPLDRM